MGYYGQCEGKDKNGKRCTRQATECHHLFSKTITNLRVYGKELINDEKNLQYLCYACHHGLKQSNGWDPAPLKKYTEREFIEVMGIEPKSKTLRGIG